MTQFDVAIIGAGAAGLFCAGIAGQRGLKVLVLDHAPKVAEKIRISGGGRSNFTNREATPANYLGENPHFCRSALAQYTSAEFIALVKAHGIAFHEKHKGQLFCDRSAQDIIDLLLAECAKGGVERWQPCGVKATRWSDASGGHFELDTDRGTVTAGQLVVATGGLSIPKIGATDFGFRLAQQFGHQVIELRPALAPLTFDGAGWAPFASLAGAALPVRVSTTPPVAKGKAKAVSFDEDLLFTHRGLSGPAILQISSYWRSGQPLSIDLAPGADLAQALKQAKVGTRKQLSNLWREVLPETITQRLATAWLESARLACPTLLDTALAAEVRDRDLEALGRSANAWAITPNGTEGYAKAEVTAGGVDTRELSSQTMESRLRPGLFFIGEVVDVTGWLGGYNFQWAWSSGAACGRALVAKGGQA
jgi:predicted Rossmann fold flavoprotein